MGGETYHELDLSGLDAKLLASGDSHIKFNAIGLHVLSQNLVTLDFPKRTMYLKRTSEWPLFDKADEAAAKSAATSASKFLDGLRKKGLLPGWSKSEHGNASAFHFDHRLHLDTLTLEVHKNGGGSTYQYTVTRAAKGDPWKLQKAWRTDENGRTIETYPVP